MTSLFICGDIVNYVNEEELCDRALKKIIKKSDYAICNFEAPIQGNGHKTAKSGIHLHQKKETVEILRQTGFNLLCLANNHIMDYGEEALQATINEIENKKLDWIGAGQDFQTAYRPLIKQFAEAKVGILNCCEAQFGVLDHKSMPSDAGYAWINHRLICKMILQLKEECDVVILLAHAGLEDVSIPQIEWREKYRLFCDLGVDLVVASHPHVPQGYETYEHATIFYSVGNFYFDEFEASQEKRDSSYSLFVRLANKKIAGIDFIYHYTENSQVCLADENEVDLEGLNKLLEEEYANLHEEISEEAYESILAAAKLFSKPATARIKGAIKSNPVVRRLFRKTPIDRHVTNMHYLRNESYYYAIKNALIDKVHQ